MMTMSGDHHFHVNSGSNYNTTIALLSTDSMTKNILLVLCSAHSPPFPSTNAALHSNIGLPNECVNVIPVNTINTLVFFPETKSEEQWISKPTRNKFASK